MSHVLVRVSENSSEGSVLCFDETNSTWIEAIDDSKAFGVLIESPFQDEVNSEIFWGKIVFNGITYAKASRDIPDCGGFLQVESGKVFVTQTKKNSLILPNVKEKPLRVSNELVMIRLS